MQKIETFNSNLGTAIAIVGPAGSGKTVLGMRLFPKTYVLVADLNFKSGLDYLRSKNELGNIVGFDTVLVDEKGQKIPPNLRYDRFWKLINEAAENPDVDAIFVDSATFITEYIIAKIVGATTEAGVMIAGGKESWPKWAAVAVTWRGIVTQLRATGKKFVLAVHEAKNLDESDQIWKHELLIPGQTKDLLPNLMSDLWRTEVKEHLGKHEWMVRLLPNVRMENLKSPLILKNGAEPVLTQDELVRRVRKLSDRNGAIGHRQEAITSMPKLV
jgi:AAA domain